MMNFILLLNSKNSNQDFLPTDIYSFKKEHYNIRKLCSLKKVNFLCIRISIKTNLAVILLLVK